MHFQIGFGFDVIGRWETGWMVEIESAQRDSVGRSEFGWKRRSPRLVRALGIIDAFV